MTGAAVSSPDSGAAAASIPGGRFDGVVTSFSKENSFTYLNPNLTGPVPSRIWISMPPPALAAAV